MMAGPAQKFYCLWQEKSIRERLFEELSNEDICALRVANSACCNIVTKRLFIRTHVEFNASTFTKPTRIQALSRIGQHIEHLIFTFPHSEATFLPPLIHPQTGEEINFRYTPYTSMGSVLSRPKYGQSELGELLTNQYPPLFHAASNVPSFINAMKHTPNLRHLTIRTPGQNPRERYRRDIVDYALISLRISIERAFLPKLNKLSLSGVHPAAFNYLRFTGGFGCVPSAKRRWAQIRKLYMSVESWDFYGSAPGLDHLKIIDDYIRSFSENVEKFTFTWLGQKGPCPLAIQGDRLFATSRHNKKLFNEVTSPMSPLPPAPAREPVHFPHVRYMAVRNAAMNESQLRELVGNHQATVREFDFENVSLRDGGSWEDALAPLRTRRSADTDVWSQTTLVGAPTAATPSEWASSRTATSSRVELDLPSPSAAVAAASKELLETDLEQFVFGESGRADGVEQWRQCVGAAAAAEEKAAKLDMDDLASEIAYAKETSQSFTTKLKKRRIRKKSHSTLASEPVDEERRPHRSRSQSRHKRSHSDEPEHRHRSHSRHHRLRKHHSAELPPLPTQIPEVVGSEDEAEAAPSSPRPLSSPRPVAPLKISAPILDAEPTPLLLKPTVYNPVGASHPAIAACYLEHDLTAQPADGLSSVQREIDNELRLAEAEASAARMSALQKAKEAVLSKLSREFRKRSNSDGLSHSGYGSRAVSKDSAAVGSLVSLKLDLGTSLGGIGSCAAAAQSSSVVMGLRLREASSGSGHGFWGKTYGTGSVMPDHRSLESQSALVPLIFSRS